MKQIYTVNVIGIYIKDFEVRAENPEQAKQLAQQVYRDSNLIEFDKDSVDMVNIEVIPTGDAEMNCDECPEREYCDRFDDECEG